MFGVMFISFDYLHFPNLLRWWELCSKLKRAKSRWRYCSVGFVSYSWSHKSIENLVGEVEVLRCNK